MLLTELRILAVDTGRLFWRLLPQVLGLYLLGWLGAQLALKIAVAVGEGNAWLALIVFSFNFLVQLVVIVLILRLAGRELGVWDLIPEDEAVADGRDQSLTQLLAVTLLPFLGLYAAFGQVSKAASEVTTEQALRAPVRDPGRSILGALNLEATQHTWRFLALLIGLYVLRRVLDVVHDRTGVRMAGLAVALVESFFLLLVILGGIRIWQLAKLWITDRAIVGWWSQAKDAALDLLRAVWVRLPDVVLQTAAFVREQVWPLFWEVLSQPIIWLAVAALVFGSQVLSLAELWRKGQPVAGRIPGATVFARHRDKLLARRIGPPPAGVRRVAGEARAVFLGDLDDKYLPTFHSLRLVLRAGAPFLVAYVLLYNLVEVQRNYLHDVVLLVVGGHRVDFWYMFGPLLDLLFQAPLEPLRICLLAVAFRRCLELFHVRRVQGAVAPQAVRVLAPAGPSPEPAE